MSGAPEDIRRFALGALVGASALLCLSGCKGEGEGGSGKGGRRGSLAFPVEVIALVESSIDYSVNAVGSVEAFERIQVTARVAGVVERVRFREGDVVKQGAALVDIEPARFEVASRVAQAALARATAGKTDAENGLRRRETAVATNPGLLPEEELDAFRTRLRLAEAEVAQTQAQLDQANLNLRDAYVRATTGGVIETRSVETGQYVQPGTVLATLVRRDPLLLRFAVSAEDAERLRLDQEVAFTVASRDTPSTAKITHIGQAADSRSRMVSISAAVSDADAASLRPGAFAEVTVAVGVAATVVVPQKAVRPSERGFLAYVVDGEIAHERLVQTGMRTKEGLLEIRSGLKPGDTLVIRGGEALFEGAKVKVVTPGEGQPVGPVGQGGAEARP